MTDINPYDTYWKDIEEVYREDPAMIEHTRRVYTYALRIAEELAVSGEEKHSALLAALLHDVGIVEAYKKYGSRDGEYQHREGPPIARRIMERKGEKETTRERVVFIVGHHHDFSQVDGVDFRILVEADMLVNLPELLPDSGRWADFIEEFFQTNPGKNIARETFLRGYDRDGNDVL